MERLAHLFRQLRWRWLIPLAIFAALAPWPFGPEPHVLEKTRWLLAGYLDKPLDIFDLLFHLSPTFLAGVKGLISARDRAGAGEPAE